jgi:Colicin immunity protein / pyocin immunity protein
MRSDLTRGEMIALVTRIFNAGGGAEGMRADIELFVANCKHPKGTDLIFWPDGFPVDPTKPEPTVEEVVDKAMSGEGS